MVEEKNSEDLLMKRIILIFGSLAYIFVLLLLSTFIVFLIPSFHQPYLTSNDAVQTDLAITHFLRGASVNTLPSGLTDAEKQHLVDVRRLLIYLAIAFVFSLRIVFYSWRNKPFSRKIRWQTGKRKPLLASERLGILLVPFVFLSFFVYISSLFSFFHLLDFQKFFLFLHHVFFPQGNFAFPMDSLLIQTYPQTFFQGMFAQGMALFVTLAVLVVVVFVVVKKKELFW